MASEHIDIARLRGIADGTYTLPNPPPLDTTTATLFGGLARATLATEREELAPGLELRRTYAHVFAPAMVAFAPPGGPGGVHPGPWAAAMGGGTAENVCVEIYLAKGARPLTVDRLETIRLVASLIRLVAGSPVCVPIVANTPLAVGPGSPKPPVVWSLEHLPRWRVPEVVIAEPQLALLRACLQPENTMLHDNDVFRAYNLVDGLWWLPTWTAQMVAMWTGAEMLMRPGRRGVGASLANSIRSFLGSGRRDGDRLYNDVLELYAARGGAAHGGRQPSATDITASFGIVRRLLIACLLEGRPPPDDARKSRSEVE